MQAFGIETPLRFASEYKLAGAKSERLIDMCEKSSADIFLFGSQGKDYADVDAFKSHGIVPLFQEYNHPEYTQLSDKEFAPFMSAIDLLLNNGPDSKDIMMSGNPDARDYLALAQR